MIHRTTCNNCGSLLEYDSTSTHEGLRDLEDILLPRFAGKKLLPFLQILFLSQR